MITLGMVMRVFNISDKLVDFVKECISGITGDNLDRFSPGIVSSNQLSKTVSFISVEDKNKFFRISYAANDSDYKSNEVVVEVGSFGDIINSRVKRFFIDGGSEQIVAFVEEGLKW